MASVPAATVPEPKLSKEGTDFFENRIRPVLVHHCYECHSGDPAKAKGHLVLDTRDGLRKGGDSGAPIVVGHADDSLLIEAIRYEGLEMPPKGKLADEIIDDFVTWIGMGAPDPRSGKAANPKNKVDLNEARRYWAFQPPKVHPVKPKDKSWPAGPIDELVRVRQEQAGVHPVADADRTTLIRRLSFDLTGLPPTPEEIDAFVADKSAGAYLALVDRLLASPQFGERWARHWLDVVRYGESTGKDRNLPYRYAWRYRDYVIDAFNRDLPYDRFVLEQLAGDLLPSQSGPEHDRLLTATGLLALGPKGINVKNPEQFQMDQVDDQIDVTTRAFLGLTVACARCHDHKFDPIPTGDYYAMAGIFHSTRTYSGIAPGKRTVVDRQLLSLSVMPKSIQGTPEQLEKQTARQQEIGKLEAEIESLKTAQRESRRAQMRQQKGKKGGPKNNPYVAPIDPKKTREAIKKAQDKIDELEGVPSIGELVMGVRDADSPANVHVLERGELDKKGPEVQRGVLTVLRTQAASQIPPRHSGRLELAHWIASKDNPLTARVMVNRVWQHLLGDGLVDTVDNFGALGNAPTNPELLDYLAVQFMKDNWSVKNLIRAIVLSRTYRLGSQYDETNFAKDPDNHLLWRRDRRRLDAEEIRDAMLAVAGQLDLKPPTSSPILELANDKVGGVKRLQGGNGRSVYLPIPRGAVPDTLQVFDMADPMLIFGKRDVTTVPTQALYIMNDPFVLKQAGELAKRVLNQPNLDQDGRITWAYRQAIGRPPTSAERESVSHFLADFRKSLAEADKKANPQVAAWTCFCQTLFGVGEFRYVY